MKLLKFFVYSNIFVAFPVTFLSLETFLLANNKIDFQILIFTYFSTLFLYSFHRYIGVVNTPEHEFYSERMIWSKKHLKIILAITTLSGLVALISFFNLSHKPILTLIPCAIIALGYSIPIWLKNGKLIRLRDIDGIKLFLIGVVVAVITTIIPFYETLNISVFLILVGRFFFILGITIPFDIRDFDLDNSHKLKTLPIIIGKKKAIQLSNLFILFFIATSCFSTIINYISLNHTIALCASGIAAIFVISFSSKQKSDLFFAYVIEGLMILQCSLVYFSTTTNPFF